MRNCITLVFLLFGVVNCFGQKLYVIGSLKGEFAGISYARQHMREEFRPSVPRIIANWRIDMLYKQGKLIHRISLEQSALEKNFKIINKFKTPPNDNQLGFSHVLFGTGIDHLILGYSLHRDAAKEKGFLFRSKIKFNYSVGVGIGFNRSKDFYHEVYPSSAGGWQSADTYVTYEATHYRAGAGVFLKGTAGFYFVNRKGKPRLCFNLFYNQGLKDMVHYDIHYTYGYWNDPSREVDVPKQVLRSRGTTFGFSLGLPFTIKR